MAILVTATVTGFVSRRVQADPREVAVLGIDAFAEWPGIFANYTEAGELESGLPSRRLDARGRQERGFPEGGSAWLVEIPGRRPSGNRVILHASAERPWEGKGAIPLVSLSPLEHARG